MAEERVKTTRHQFEEAAIPRDVDPAVGLPLPEDNAAVLALEEAAFAGKVKVFRPVTKLGPKEPLRWCPMALRRKGYRS